MGICLKCNGSGFKHNGKVCKCKIYKYWFIFNYNGWCSFLEKERIKSKIVSIISKHILMIYSLMTMKMMKTKIWLGNIIQQNEKGELLKHINSC